ncbi:hypothetical protein H7C19_26350 [Cohnella nanjingensis]|uniref:Uncharacterized protein n=1 Tax=Cohnella nanjingensis TaxID=1387779 RepID=A0A7X0RY33_9BACL|nr:hypothetical protein [Cohnella nanjingensis]
MFEKRFEAFWKEQVRLAKGQRQEMLQRDLTGTKKMLETVLLTVFGSFDGLILEHEMVSLSGVKIYGDVYHPKLRTVFEEEHYVTHAEKITRDRYAFERARARSVATLGYVYFPYSRDELDKKMDFCQRNLYELIGRVGQHHDAGLLQLPVYEREVLRMGLFHQGLFRIADVAMWLQLRNEACRGILRSLESKDLIEPRGGGAARRHTYRITEKAVELLHRSK